MKKLTFFCFVVLLMVVVCCTPNPSGEQRSADSSAVAKESPDSISMAQEAAQSNDEPADDSNAPDTNHDRDVVAPNISQYKFLGFSDDLNYAAFTIGWRANSGPDISAALYVVDVDRNTLVGKPVTSETSDAEIDEAVGMVMENGKTLLARYNISGTNTGTSHYVDEESNVNIPFDTKIYKLRLIEKSGPDANRFFELQVLTDGEPIILQSDAHTPRSRGEVVSYKVVALFILEDKVAVFVEYTSPDAMDGENHPYYTARQLLVTGSLIPKQD